MNLSRRGFFQLTQGFTGWSLCPKWLRRWLHPEPSYSVNFTMGPPPDTAHRVRFYSDKAIATPPPHCGEIVVDFKDITIGQWADYYPPPSEKEADPCA